MKNCVNSFSSLLSSMSEMLQDGQKSRGIDISGEVETEVIEMKYQLKWVRKLRLRLTEGMRTRIDAKEG